MESYLSPFWSFPVISDDSKVTVPGYQVVSVQETGSYMMQMCYSHVSSKVNRSLGFTAGQFPETQESWMEEILTVHALLVPKLKDPKSIVTWVLHSGVTGITGNKQWNILFCGGGDGTERAWAVQLVLLAQNAAFLEDSSVIFKNKRKRRKSGSMAQTCGPSYLGIWSRRITWIQEFKTSLGSTERHSLN
jgi:hypothetical protein